LFSLNAISLFCYLFTVYIHIDLLLYSSVTLAVILGLLTPNVTVYFILLLVILEWSIVPLSSWLSASYKMVFFSTSPLCLWLSISYVL